MTARTEREARARITHQMSHPEVDAVVLGTLQYWTSDAARAEYTDAERLAAVDSVMAQHLEAVSGS